MNTKLLLCLVCLSPNDSLAAFDKDNLACLAQFYPKEFSPIKLTVLKTQFQTYIIDMHYNSGFTKLKGIGDLAKRMVENKKEKKRKDVSISIFVGDITIHASSFHSHKIENIFNNEIEE